MRANALLLYSRTYTPQAKVRAKELFRNITKNRNSNTKQTNKNKKKKEGKKQTPSKKPKTAIKRNRHFRKMNFISYADAFKIAFAQKQGI